MPEGGAGEGVCDRASDMVISGGVNIYPAEIEATLALMPGVRDCAVFGIPDEEFGEALCAAVQLDPGASLSSVDVQSFLKGRIATYKVPSKVDFHAALPREDSGKSSIAACARLTGRSLDGESRECALST